MGTIPKPESLTSENVFLDTCIFLEEKFNSSAYQTLIHLGAIDAVKLKITDITLKEIRKNMEEKVGEALVSLHARKGKSAILHNFDDYSELMGKFKYVRQRGQSGIRFWIQAGRSEPGRADNG